MFNMIVRRELPNKEVIELDPLNIQSNWNHTVEDWMEEYGKITYNRIIPTIIEDMPRKNLIGKILKKRLPLRILYLKYQNRVILVEVTSLSGFLSIYVLHSLLRALSNSSSLINVLHEINTV